MPLISKKGIAKMEALIKFVEEGQIRTDIPAFRAGDTVNVYVRIKEGDKERIQQYKGVCIQRKNPGIRATFTVRKISSGVGVERVFPIHSPNIEKIEVLKRGKVRRAKLYYLRDKVGKQARIKERI